MFWFLILSHFMLSGGPDGDKEELYIVFYLEKRVQKHSQFLYSNILKVLLCTGTDD